MDVPTQYEVCASRLRPIPESLSLGRRNLHRDLYFTNQSPKHRESSVSPVRCPRVRLRRKRIVMNEDHKGLLAALPHQPVGLGIPYTTDPVLHDDGVAMESNGPPRKGHRIEDRDPQPALQRLDPGRGPDHPSGACIDRRVKRSQAPPQDRRRIPKASSQTPEVRVPARMPAARGEIVIAVQQSQAFRVEQRVRGQKIEHAFEQGRVPAIQQVPGNGQMSRCASGDARELAVQPRDIAGVFEVKIGEMRDHHALTAGDAAGRPRSLPPPPSRTAAASRTCHLRSG